MAKVKIRYISSEIEEKLKAEDKAKEALRARRTEKFTAAVEKRIHNIIDEIEKIQEKTESGKKLTDVEKDRLEELKIISKEIIKKVRNNKLLTNTAKEEWISWILQRVK